MHSNDFDRFDKTFQAHLGQLTSGISPAALSTSYFSWLSQLAQSPGRLMELALYPAMHWKNCANKTCSLHQPAEGKDQRFKAQSWQQLPWNIWAENFSMTKKWWELATSEIPGLPQHVERTVSFVTKQMLDAASPSNFVLTNPELFKETVQSNGSNLVNWVQSEQKDLQNRLSGKPAPGMENFVVGKNLAITPGNVVFRNHLIELIQYTPQSKTVYKEPVLILPAWIMKYYILDLSPNNSLVNWLVAQGHTVFMVSWRNPDADDRDLGLDDYYRQGAMAAIDFIDNLMPNVGIHLTGYCLGGTLAVLTAASMAGQSDTRLKSLTLLAAQTDFSEAGELLLFVTESEVAFLKNMMWEKGYLDGKQMAGTFEMLHSNELIWSKLIDARMNKKRRGVIDLLAWNADATRLPYKMHSEYLEKLFLNNDFAEGRFAIEDQRVVPESIPLPIFAVSTEEDHVAPWRSVHKIHSIVPDKDITFVLSTGGHNAGIVSEPKHKGRSYHIHTTPAGAPYQAPTLWLKSAQHKEGSWWLAWQDWLVNQSDSKTVAPPKLNKGLCKAPGTYVLQQ